MSGPRGGPAAGPFVGWFCLWPMEGRVAELGYRLRRAEWGQGLATEGASALIAWGFASARYDRIVANAMAVNHASRRVMAKLGLRYARTIHAGWADAIPGSEEGDVEYEILRADWEAPPARCSIMLTASLPLPRRVSVGGRGKERRVAIHSDRTPH